MEAPGSRNVAPSDILALARQVAGIVRRATRSPGYRVFLFGSHVSGEAGPRSDIDIECVSPRECLRVAFILGLVEDDAQWMSMIEDRNRACHTYDETTARAVYGGLPGYARLLCELRRRLAEGAP